VTRVRVPAKINLALVVGDRRSDGLHEIASVLQRVDVCDRLELAEATALHVEGFAADTLVHAGLTRLAEAVGVEPRWRVRIGKRIPVAAGLGGGSADAAAALRLANRMLAEPLSDGRLAEVAAKVGADVPFFLDPGPKLAEGGGELLKPLDLPQDFWIVIALPRESEKVSTRDVYERYDQTNGGNGFRERRDALLDVLERCRRPRDFAAFPENDLARAAERPVIVLDLLAAGAFRADLSGAGPAVFGLFHHRGAAVAAARRVIRKARVWVTAPVW
jgi:4-diphosphocytidyl-2-C-methyl-D-erythritol kinase